MTQEEYTSTMRWVTDQYRMAVDLTEGYLPVLRAIPGRVKSGDLSAAEGKRLFAEYDRMKERLDRHMAEVREIEAECERVYNEERAEK